MAVAPVAYFMGDHCQNLPGSKALQQGIVNHDPPASTQPAKAGIGLMGAAAGIGNEHILHLNARPPGHVEDLLLHLLIMQGFKTIEKRIDAQREEVAADYKKKRKNS